MNDPDSEGSDAEHGFAEEEEAVVSFSVGSMLIGRFMGGVNVDVRAPAMIVLMQVQFAAQDVPSSADAEVDQHDANAEFEVWCN